MRSSGILSTKVQPSEMEEASWEAHRAQMKLSPDSKPLIIVGAGDDTDSDVSMLDMIFKEKLVNQEPEDAMTEEKELTNKERMVQVFEVLEIDQKVLERLPKAGFKLKNADVDKKDRNYFRAKQIVSSVVERLCEVVCPGDERFRAKMVDRKWKRTTGKAKDSELISLESKIITP